MISDDATDWKTITSWHVLEAAHGADESRAWLAIRLKPFLLAQARYCLGKTPRLRREYDASDFEQRAWLKFRWDALRPKARPSAVLRAYLATIIARDVLNEDRRCDTRRRRHLDPVGSSEREPFDQLAAETREAVELASLDEASRQVLESIEALPERRRAVFLMRSMEDAPAGVIAKVLGITESLVAKDYQRARDELAKTLPDEYREIAFDDT